MGFTTLLMLAYLTLFVLDAAAFVYGRQRKSWLAFALITALMALGIVVLGYLWVTSPM